MVRELKSLQTVTSIREPTQKENLTAMVNTIGLMGATLREISRKGLGKAMECGKRDQEWATSTRGSTRLIKSTGMEFFPGHQAMFIRVIMTKIWGQDTEKCTGVMAAITKEIG